MKIDVKEIRKKLYYSQKRLAMELEVSVNTVACWERGIHKPNITQMGKLIVFCNKHNIEIQKQGE